MALQNKLGIMDSIELAHEEERLTKKRALELYDKKILDRFEVGTFAGLKDIHGYLFQDVYDFAGKMRTVNIAKARDAASVASATQSSKTRSSMRSSSHGIYSPRTPT